jgi:hypothetical protein
MGTSLLLRDRHDIIVESSRTQLEYFTRANPFCRGLQLPEGVMLRYNCSEPFFFYLRTRVEDGKIFTRVYATDTPYELQKSCIGEVSTSLFDAEKNGFDLQADLNQLEKLEVFLNSWVDFIRIPADDGEERYTSFALHPHMSTSRSHSC